MQAMKRETRRVENIHAKSILTKPSGFVDFFDYTLNPYSGCAFGCSYCYAAFFARSQELQESWGKWVQVKATALELLRKRRKKPMIDKSIYMSTVTDPYQPVEQELGLTRAILEELLRYHRVRLVLQTRAALVTRDLDLLREFEYAQVNMTVTTDDETVRRTFEPTCPPNAKRIDAIRQVREAGVRSAITMTPLLPVRDPITFAETLLATGVQKFVIQSFHTTTARFVAGTGAAARSLAAQMGWNETRYQEVHAIMREKLPNLQEGKPGFAPVWD
jgi:DNA repair photolyase